ncbi:hypothetical protein, partial [Xylella fastidiosa]|uniref:hypothetical protein n=1 Tax=Xylella fastidiosa TaxID=2371 RepID=UPI0019D55BE2
NRAEAFLQAGNDRIQPLGFVSAGGDFSHGLLNRQGGGCGRSFHLHYQLWLILNDMQTIVCTWSNSSKPALLMLG